MVRTQRLVSFGRRFLLAAAFAMPGPFGRVWAAGNPCPAGWWADFMIGSHHIHPARHFDDFNPGVGLECSINRQWAAAGGYFRNSLDRPSFYAGALITPELTDWRWIRLGAVGRDHFGIQLRSIRRRRGSSDRPVVRAGGNYPIRPVWREFHLGSADPAKQYALHPGLSGEISVQMRRARGVPQVTLALGTRTRLVAENTGVRVRRFSRW